MYSTRAESLLVIEGFPVPTTRSANTKPVILVLLSRLLTIKSLPQLRTNNCSSSLDHFMSMPERFVTSGRYSAVSLFPCQSSTPTPACITRANRPAFAAHDRPAIDCQGLLALLNLCFRHVPKASLLRRFGQTKLRSFSILQTKAPSPAQLAPPIDRVAHALAPSGRGCKRRIRPSAASHVASQNNNSRLFRGLGLEFSRLLTNKQTQLRVHKQT
ncbi:hypothetical protein J3F83DRAFT_17016 [Trichoderma novae-zelandiae]